MALCGAGPQHASRQLPGRSRRNYYTSRFTKAVFELLERYREKGEAVLLVRSVTAGGQRFPIH